MGKRRLRTACAFNVNLRMVIYFWFRERLAGISRLAKDGSKQRKWTGRAVQAVPPLVQHFLGNRIDSIVPV